MASTYISLIGLYRSNLSFNELRCHRKFCTSLSIMAAKKKKKFKRRVATACVPTNSISNRTIATYYIWSKNFFGEQSKHLAINHRQWLIMFNCISMCIVQSSNSFSTDIYVRLISLVNHSNSS